MREYVVRALKSCRMMLCMGMTFPAKPEEWEETI